jgi:hypothetical protein
MNPSFHLIEDFHRSFLLLFAYIEVYGCLSPGIWKVIFSIFINVIAHVLLSKYLYTTNINAYCWRWSWVKSIQCPLSLTYFPNTHLYGILPSSKWSLSKRFPNENFVCSPSLSHPSYLTSPASLISLIMIMMCDLYKSWGSHYLIFSWTKIVTEQFILFWF